MKGKNLSRPAIVSRELQIPCIVGAKNATKVLKEGQTVTVDATRGVVYEGEVLKEEKKAEEKKRRRSCCIRRFNCKP